MNLIMDPPPPVQPRRRGGALGMVTAELAVGLLGVVTVLALVLGVAGAIQVQTRCVDAASEIARQSARGDQIAVERVIDTLPAAARIERNRRAGAIVVTVAIPVQIGNLPIFTASATVQTLLEPGV